MTITETLAEIVKRREAIQSKIDEVKKMDDEFQKFLFEHTGINEKAPLSPETILLAIEKFIPKDK